MADVCVSGCVCLCNVHSVHPPPSPVMPSLPPSPVMGPTVHAFPPLFRQNGPYPRHIHFQPFPHTFSCSDLCINRQPRPAFRCNLSSKVPR